MLDINNEKDSEAIKEVLRTGIKSDFWNLIVQKMQEAQKFLQQIRDSEDLQEESPEQYKLKSELLKSKIKYLNILISAPEDLISELQNPDNKKPDFDPYD